MSSLNKITPSLNTKLQQAAGRVGGALYQFADNEFGQAVIGFCVFVATALFACFTDVGQDVTADLLVVIMEMANVFLDLFGLPRIDVGGMV